ERKRQCPSRKNDGADSVNKGRGRPRLPPPLHLQACGRYFGRIVVEATGERLAEQLHSMMRSPLQAPSAQTARIAKMLREPSWAASGPTAWTITSPRKTASGFALAVTRSAHPTCAAETGKTPRVW